MIVNNQTYEGVSSMDPLAVGNASTVTVPNTGYHVISHGNVGGVGLGSAGTYEPQKIIDTNHRNREMILLLQVQHPEIYKQIADALNMRDKLTESSQW